MIVNDARDDKLLLDGQDDWKGGVYNNAHCVNIAYDQLSDLRNGEIRTPGRVDLRRGGLAWGDALAGTIQCLDFFRTSSVSARLIAMSSGSFYYREHGGSWTNTVGITVTNSTTRIETQFFVDSTYIFSGVSSDHVWRYTGAGFTDMGDPTTNTNPPNSLISCVQVDRVWIAVGPILYYSANRAHTFNQTNQTLACGSDAAENITGILPLGSKKILVGKERSTWIADCSGATTAEWFTYKISDNGCVHHKSMAGLGNLGLWLSTTGVHTASELDTGLVQVGEEPLSDRIQEYISRIDFSKEFNAITYDNYYILKITRSDNTIEMFPYDWTKKSWAGYWDTWNPIFFCKGRLNNTEKLFCITSAGQAKELLTGEHDDGTFPTLDFTTRGLIHENRNLEKESVSVDSQFLTGYGDSTIRLINDSNQSFTVATYSNVSGSVWGSFTFPITWGALTLTRKGRVVPKRRSLWWQIRFTHTGGFISIKQVALSAFVHPFRMVNKP